MLGARLRDSYSPSSATLVLGRRDIERLLTIEDCIIAVEDAFRRHARGETLPPSVLGTHVEGGGFHVKAAGLHGVATTRSVYAVKINANFPSNPRLRGLPTIQGMIVLFDATNGRVLAQMDSVAITSLRTAAATAVAAKYLAPAVARVTLCGCGEQGRHQLRALECVRTLDQVRVYDIDNDRARQFASEISASLGTGVTAIDHLSNAAPETSVWITCTPSRRWFLGRAHVGRGAFVAAVGADNPDKQEIEPELLMASAVVADVLEQCVTSGDLHHALDAGVMRREDVRAELADVVLGTKRGRQSADEIVIFDSTGTALEDVAAALVVYEHAIETGAGAWVDMSGSITALTSRESLHT
jgi:ornithine cyclodeaminase/alanine dehydrogenase-like protein (mu-crystallin family)